MQPEHRGIVALGPQGVRVQPVRASGSLEHRHGDGGACLGVATVDPLGRPRPDDEAPCAGNRYCGYHRGKPKRKIGRQRLSWHRAELLQRWNRAHRKARATPITRILLYAPGSCIPVVMTK